MSRNGSGVYSLPAGSAAVDNTIIDPVVFNTLISDLESDANTARPIVAGGTGATTSAAARTNLGITPLTNGIIIGTRWIQWGTYTPPNNSSQQWAVTFGTTFPTACRGVVATINNNTVAIGTVATYGLSTTGFAFGQNWIGGQTANLSIYWQAVGD